MKFKISIIENGEEYAVVFTNEETHKSACTEVKIDAEKALKRAQELAEPLGVKELFICNNRTDLNGRVL